MILKNVKDKTYKFSHPCESTSSTKNFLIVKRGQKRGLFIFRDERNKRLSVTK